MCVWLGWIRGFVGFEQCGGPHGGNLRVRWLCHTLRVCVCDFFLPLHVSAVTLVPFLSHRLKVGT